MFKALITRDWATPLTLGAFALSAVTGLLMFFHADSGLNKPAHEWLSWALLIGVALHGVANFSALKRHLTRRGGLAVVGLFGALLALSFLSLGGGDKGPPHVRAAEAMLKAPLPLAAQVAEQDLDAALARLHAAGFDVGPNTSLAQIAGPSREARIKALGVFLGR